MYTIFFEAEGVQHRAEVAAPNIINAKFLLKKEIEKNHGINYTIKITGAYLLGIADDALFETIKEI